MEFLKRFQPTYTDVVGVDIASTGVKAVRLRKTKKGLVVAAVDLLPAVSVAAAVEAGAVPAVVLPKSMRARYVSMAYSADTAVVKFLNFPGASDQVSESQILELMGLGNTTDFRVSFDVIVEGHGRSESKLLAVGVPEVQAKALCQMFPAGIPAPCSMEVSGLASMTAFLRGPGEKHLEDCVVAVDFGAMMSLVAIFNKGVLALIRRFDFGMDSITKKIQESLGVDAETAQGILADGAFDISQSVSDALKPFTQQLVISRDFVERRENCHMKKVYVCGGASLSRDWMNVVQNVTGLETEPWNPFEGLTVAEGAVPASLQGQEARFSAALGAAMGTVGES